MCILLSLNGYSKKALKSNQPTSFGNARNNLAKLQKGRRKKTIKENSKTIIIMDCIHFYYSNFLQIGLFNTIMIPNLIRNIIAIFKVKCLDLNMSYTAYHCNSFQNVNFLILFHKHNSLAQFRFLTRRHCLEYVIIT